MSDVKIGIIDDQRFKARHLRQNIKLFFEDGEVDSELKEYNVKAKVINPKDKIEFIVNEIVDKKFDVLIIDYNLSSGANINYNGVDLAEYVRERFDEFPVFILTGVIQDLYDEESYPASFVFNSVDYTEKEEIKKLVNENLVRECIMYRKRTKEIETDLLELSKKIGESVQVDNEIIKLQNKLAMRCFNDSNIPFEIIDVDVLGKLTAMNQKLDKLIEKVKNEN